MQQFVLGFCLTAQLAFVSSALGFGGLEQEPRKLPNKLMECYQACGTAEDLAETACVELSKARHSVIRQCFNDAGNVGRVCRKKCEDAAITNDDLI